MRQCDVENGNDFARYYTHGWIALPRPDLGVVFPFKIRTGNATVVIGNILQKDGEKYTTQQHETTFNGLKETASFGRPHVGMLHDGPTLVYLSQRSERNSSRGLRLDRGTQHDFNSWYLRKFKDQMLRNAGNERLDLIWESFNPNYESVRSAFAKLESGESCGTPLALHYGMYTVPDSPRPLLAYKRWTIGTVENQFRINLQRRFIDYREEIERKLNVGVVIL